MRRGLLASRPWSSAAGGADLETRGDTADAEDGRFRFLGRPLELLVRVVIAMHDVLQSVAQQKQMVSDLIDEKAVVRDKDHGTVECSQRALQRGPGPEIEMIGGLV